MTHPIPDIALDDRLGIVGTAGSGKTYLAKGCVERLLVLGHRVVIVDPLGVWWGLRLRASGSAGGPGKDVAILGGKHGDLPLTENSGAIIGEAVARSAESCIVCLDGIKTSAARQRFMLAFLDALYEKTSADREPYHLVVDEADLWAPQKPMGQEAMLCHLMEEIVRRGRVKGFIPWLITQRPAVLNKNVLSQVDGLVALRLTSSQDRDALEGWIEGQADRAEWKAMRAQLPKMDRGQGVIWLPSREICSVAQFPENKTFDSSRTPKRGEAKLHTSTLPPLDLPALKSQLATVEEEAKHSDPKTLRARVAELERALQSAETLSAENDFVDTAKLRAEAARNGRYNGYAEGFAAATKRADEIGTEEILERFNYFCDEMRNAIVDALNQIRAGSPPAVLPDGGGLPLPAARPTSHPARIERRQVPSPAAAKPSPKASGDGALSGPQLHLLKALAWWRAMGHDNPTRAQVAAIAGWRVTSGHLKNVAGSLRTLHMVDYPTDGTMKLTNRGLAAAPDPDLSVGLIDSVRGVLNGAQCAVFDALPANGGALARRDIAEACGWEPSSGHLKNVLGSLRTLEVITYPQQGSAARAPWLIKRPNIR